MDTPPMDLGDACAKIFGGIGGGGDPAVFFEEAEVRDFTTAFFFAFFILKSLRLIKII